MILYSSGRRDHLSDPEPYYIEEADSHYSRRAVLASDLLWNLAKHAPRPEFDRPLTNPANPVLAHFRRVQTPLIPLAAHAQGFLNGISRLWEEGFSIAQIEHADRVLMRLTRLASLTPKDAQ